MPIARTKVTGDRSNTNTGLENMSAFLRRTFSHRERATSDGPATGSSPSLRSQGRTERSHSITKTTKIDQTFSARGQGSHTSQSRLLRHAVSSPMLPSFDHQEIPQLHPRVQESRRSLEFIFFPSSEDLAGFSTSLAQDCNTMKPATQDVGAVNWIQHEFGPNVVSTIELEGPTIPTFNQITMQDIMKVCEHTTPDLLVDASAWQWAQLTSEKPFTDQTSLAEATALYVRKVVQAQELHRIYTGAGSRDRLREVDTLLFDLRVDLNFASRAPTQETFAQHVTNSHSHDDDCTGDSDGHRRCTGVEGLNERWQKVNSLMNEACKLGSSVVACREIPVIA